MLRRRRGRAELEPPVEAAAKAFASTLAVVEDATGSLLAAVPRGRGEGLPLAIALAGFEAGLAAARDSMPAWRVDAVAAPWSSCGAALGESARRAEVLRLGASPEAYEELAPVLAGILEPLAAFEDAAAAFRGLGARLR